MCFAPWMISMTSINPANSRSRDAFRHRTRSASGSSWPTAGVRTNPRGSNYESSGDLPKIDVGVLVVQATWSRCGPAGSGRRQGISRPNQTGEITSKSQRALREANMVDMKIEVDVIPVSDVERAKQFYKKLGWRFDDDTGPGND